jgi:nucleoside-diphosphate kinase
MGRSPVIVAVLERDNAVAEYRTVMGATDPAKAESGTIRKLYAASIGENAVHGSDSLDNAKNEIAYFFAASEVAPTAG